MNTLPEVPRDRWQRPLVVPPEGGKPVPYTRCTTFVGALEDTYNLEKWKLRQAAIGFASRPDLVMAVQACSPADKSAIDAHCQTALDVAASSAAANIGTALHKFTEAYDRNAGPLDGSVSTEVRLDIEAYAEATACLKMVGIEQFVVNDPLKVGGTFDRLVEYNGVRYIADIKTGTLDYGMGKIAMQLAMYARSRTYNPTTYERTDLDVDVYRAIVIHLPAGQGKCFLRWVDIATGWEGVHLAEQVREWRARKNLSETFEYAKATPQLTPTQTAILALVGNSQDVPTLNGLWHEYRQHWCDELTSASKQRKADLT